nr:zf-CCHC domain-containing protein/DUF4219 domain-containing protein/UBN2 domain-containing protein [Tanacetum cinerariifolium]
RHAVRDFKKFFKRRGRFVRQPQNDKKTFQRSRDDKNDKSNRKCIRCRDPNPLIRECPKPPRDQNQKTFIGGYWSDSGDEDDEKAKDETYASSEHQQATKKTEFVKSQNEASSGDGPLTADGDPIGVHTVPKANQGSPSDEWIKDSECSKHMMGNERSSQLSRHTME